MLLTTGACLFTLISAYGFGRGTDPSRVAAQIVTGIGFLGGGAIVCIGGAVLVVGALLDGDRATLILLYVKLPPRDPAERLLDALGRLEGVRHVQWRHQR